MEQHGNGIQRRWLHTIRQWSVCKDNEGDAGIIRFMHDVTSFRNFRQTATLKQMLYL